jgi:acetyl esterase/lipase
MIAQVHAAKVEDVAYYSHGGKPLLARLYHPPRGAPSAAIVSLHGGRWIQETRLTNAVIDQSLAEDGALVMAIDIRMPPVARYPACLADVNVAIRWLKARAAALGVPASKVGGLGTSSGGHQMMLSAMRPRDPRYAALPLPGDVDAALGFVVLGWPVIDPLARYRYAQAGNKTPYLEAHAAYWPSEADMEEGNPQLILERGEKAELPPTLLLQGTADEALTPDMADRFAAAYKKAGGRLELEKFDGQPHTFITKQPGTPAARTGIARIKTFVRDRAKGQ